MSAEAIKETSQTPKVLDWEPPMPPTDLIFDDGETLETSEQEWLLCETLGSWLGTIDREPAVWLQYYDGNGNLILLAGEAAAARAERLATRLRELGEDLDA
jgi:hypothetical protein